MARQHTDIIWAILHRENGNIVDVDMSFGEAKRKVRHPEVERIVRIRISGTEISEQFKVEGAQ